MNRKQRDSNRRNASRLRQFRKVEPRMCTNCREMMSTDSGHFVPPSFGDEGFFMCKPAVDKYPSVKKALIEIAYDNGMVHRGTTEADEISGMFNKMADNYHSEQIEALEAELELLTADQLRDVCSNPEQHGLISLSANEMLDTAFDF